MKYLISLISLFGSLLTYSQHSKEDFSISIGSGIDIISFKDMSSSPLTYSGFGLPMVMMANYETPKTIHQMHISLISQKISNNYPLTSKANTTLSTWEKVDFGYRFMHKIKDSPNYVGGSFDILYFYREYDFLDGQSYELIGSFGINYWRVTPISEKYRIISQISFPALAFIHRKPSLTLDEAFLADFQNDGNLLKYGKWKPNFADWIGFNLNMKHEYRFNKKLATSLEIGIEYYSINFPEKVTNINYPITCQLSYHF